MFFDPTPHRGQAREGGGGVASPGVYLGIRDHVDSGLFSGLIAEAELTSVYIENRSFCSTG